MKVKSFILLFALITIAIHCVGQDSTFLPRVVSALAAQSAQEKVYLHLDKPNYGYGDTIWYKAYTVVSQKHQPSAISGVLYVELISPKDSLVTRQVVPLVSGIGWSDIPLAHTLKQGQYRIRAYTRWMQNQPDYICDQRVRLGGVAPIMVRQTEKCDVQFFPEGGELVSGVRSRVAIKAIGANGLGRDIKGTIEDNTGNVVADFATQHLGMGVFAITPEAGKSYRAKMNIPGETSFAFDLPKTQEVGYTLSVNNSEKDSLYVKIATNESTLAKNKGRTFYIIAQSNGVVYYSTAGKLENTVYIAGIEKNRFPEGIEQFTLFGQDGEPLAERIAFINNKADEINLDIVSANSIYNARNKMQINLTAKDSSNKPIAGSFSVSVINESKVQPDENGEGTILNNLLLTSELKGYIEQPNYYFTNQTDKAKSDLDILMLTQGYRRYDWKQVLSNNPTIQPFNNPTIQYKPEHSLELSGTLTTPDGKAIPNGKVTLLATKQNLARDTTADASGRFTFTDLAIVDTATIVLRARKANNGSNVKIKAFVPDYPKITPVADLAPEFVLPDTTQRPVVKTEYSQYRQEQKNDSLKNGKLLKTVTVNARKEKPKPDLSMSSNLHGGGNADQVIMGDDLGPCVDLSDCLAGRVFGVDFAPDGGPVNTRNGSLTSRPNMSVIVDGVTMTGSHLNDVIKNDVYSIEVLRTSAAKAIYGSSIMPGGALIITTRRGGDKKRDTMRTAGQLQYSRYEQQQRADLQKGGKLLKTVTINGVKAPEKPKLQFSSNMNGPGHADQVLMWDQLGNGCILLSDCLFGKLTGVMISYKVSIDPKRKAYLQRAQNHLSGRLPMTIIVDGVILGPDHLDDVSPTEIYSIEILRSGGLLALYGSNAPGGAIIITTKHGNEGTAYFTQAQPNGIMTFPFAGYYKAKAFYVPKYDHPKTNDQSSDLRTTVYWNPNVVTDKDGKASIEFYNNDTKGTYRVVVEGINDDGRLGRSVYRYKVE